MKTPLEKLLPTLLAPLVKFDTLNMAFFRINFLEFFFLELILSFQTLEIIYF